ncbi:hypothetical protein GGR53DRAFT_175212 [Hypoxylon sp. FL1150]|nr:hypothetical protein GGR53DRAFT_175212 [Hypoxylon sp. FL1150]
MLDIDPMLEDPKPELRDDALDIQQYPIPTTGGQDGTPMPPPNSHPEQQQDQPEAIGTSPRQQNVQPSITSAEELRIAAQLSQDLSQGMPMLGPHDNPNIHSVPPRSDPLGPQIPQQGAQLRQDQLPEDNGHIQEQAEDLSRNDHSLSTDDPTVVHHGQHLHHEQPLHQEPSPHHEQPLHHDQSLHHEHSQHEHLLQHEHHLQEDQPHQYLPDQHQQEHQQMSLEPEPQHQSHLQPQGTMEQIAQHYAAQATGMPDNIPPRKRSKVSRACDECRRKKVKCDAVSENGDEPCSNCRRSAIRCLFSRIPQKRGPSKGYIKELADRIHHIEGKLASEGNGGSVDSSLAELLNGARRESADIFGSSGPPEENSRKRPYSSISGAEFATSTNSRQATWSSEPRPIQPYQTPPANSKAPYSANGLAPQPLPKPGSETPSRPSAVIDTEPLGLNHDGPSRELDEEAFSGYLNVVHPCFPLLAASKARVEGQLAQCPPPLRDAFVEALYGTMQSFVSVPGLYTNGDISSATRLVADWESDSSPRTSIMNLVHLQTLILIAISTDNYGPSSLKGEHGGPPKASILGRAVGLAYSMRLHASGFEANVDVQPEPDSNENIAIRAWWTLVMLDRWNAIGTASPLFIPNDSVVILPSLSSVLGVNVYHLARLSNILGYFAPVSLAPPRVLSPESGAAPILSSFFNLSIELFREVLPHSITPSTHPILHMVYWHCRLLAYLFQTNAKSSDILWPCKETAGLLLTNTQLLSPLNHHFFCLTVLSLVELIRVEKTREEATFLLRQLLESNLAPSTWDAVIRDHISEHIRPSTAQDTANQSLQHLADLATATEIDASKHERNSNLISLRTSDNYSDVGFDPRKLTQAGYLNALTEGHSSAMR